MYKRKTKDEYEIVQYTGAECGWELAAAYDDRKAARIDLKLYRENQPEYPVKIIKRRIPIKEA